MICGRKEVCKSKCHAAHQTFFSTTCSSWVRVRILGKGSCEFLLLKSKIIFIIYKMWTSEIFYTLESCIHKMNWWVVNNIIIKKRRDMVNILTQLLLKCHENFSFENKNEKYQNTLKTVENIRYRPPKWLLLIESRHYFQKPWDSHHTK